MKTIAQLQTEIRRIRMNESEMTFAKAYKVRELLKQIHILKEAEAKK